MRSLSAVLCVVGKKAAVFHIRTRLSMFRGVALHKWVSLTCKWVDPQRREAIHSSDWNDMLVIIPKYGKTSARPSGMLPTCPTFGGRHLPCLGWALPYLVGLAIFGGFAMCHVWVVKGRPLPLLDWNGARERQA